MSTIKPGLQGLGSHPMRDSLFSACFVSFTGAETWQTHFCSVIGKQEQQKWGLLLNFHIPSKPV